MKLKSVVRASICFMLLSAHSLSQIKAAQASLNEVEVSALKKMLNDSQLESSYVRLIESQKNPDKLGGVEFPKSDVLDQAITTKVGAGAGCNDPKWPTCEERYRVTYADYLRAKIKVKQQRDLLKSGAELEGKFSDFYQKTVSQDQSYGGKAYTDSLFQTRTQISQNITDTLDDRSKQYWSWGNFGNLLQDSFVQSTKMVGSAVKFDAQAVTGIARLKLQSMKLNPEYADSVVKAVNQSDLRQLEKIQGKYDFIQKSIEILSEAFDGRNTLLNDPIKLKKLVSGLSTELAKISRNDRVAAFGDISSLMKSIEEYDELLKLKDILRDPSYSGFVDQNDINYIDTAISKAGFDVLFAIAKVTKNAVEVIPGLGKATPWIKEISNIVEAADNFRQAYREMTGFFDEQDLRMAYRQVQAQADRNQIYLNGLSKFSEVSLNSFTKYMNDLNTGGSGSSWQLVSLMQSQLTSITQGGSSHIGSGAYYLGRSPQSDTVEMNNAQQAQQFSASRTPSIQQREEYLPAGSITNLTAPVDIVLNWNQLVTAGQLDLDSHLTGPSGLGADSPVRFHTRFDERGSITGAPYTLLYKDVIPKNGDSGPEQTRIQVLQTNGVYRFYVHDYTNRNSTQSTDLSNSGANVSVHNGLGLTTAQARDTVGPIIGSPILVPTNQGGNVWYVLQLDSKTGILRRVNVPFIYESDRTKVPRIGER